ncbi:MAG TPA: hypothetical protein VF114_05755 [Candidatus Limnocylindria bacterium]
MSEIDQPRPDPERREEGPRVPPDATTLDSIRALIREERRMSMRARTLRITLESALRDYDEVQRAEPADLRFALRRDWCERVLDMVQEVRTNAMRNRHAFELIAEQVKVGKSGTARFAAARRDFELQADRAEETAINGMSESA